MEIKAIPFKELMEAVLDQLRSQNYMESTLKVYRRTYERVHVFLRENATDMYTHESGKRFLGGCIVCRSTFVAYACAIRRLDDFINGEPYRCHHSVYKDDVLPVFSSVLSGYLRECQASGNKAATILAKERTCVAFLNFVEQEGFSHLSEINTDIIARALLTFSNKDHYAPIRQFLRYLFDKDILDKDLSGIVPRYKRRIPLPTTYTPDEIGRIEGSIDLDTDTGRRNLAIIRLASRMGLRAGDIAKLKLSEVKFDIGYITITQEKTGIPLTLQMPCEVSEALLKHIENGKYSSEDGYVFHRMTAPHGHITTSIIRHALNECFISANINTAGKKHGPHAFRSSLASSMVNDGISYEVVRRILGHSDPNIIKHYAKTDIEKLRSCAIDPPAPSGLFLDYLSGRRGATYV